MKRILILTSLLLPATVFCCDICGCGAGNNYIGILPEFRRHIFGLRYRYNALLTHVGAGGATTYLTSSERYHTAEAWAGWNITPSFRMMAVLPYQYDVRENGSARQSKQGMGDISLSAFYRLLNGRKTTTSHRLLIQELWVGAGVKIATGRYTPADKGPGTYSANLFQLGTGSNDFLAQLMYDLRLQDAGINLQSQYKLNTANTSGYRYGSKLSLNAQAYYKFRVAGKWTISPNAGCQYETSAKDSDNGFGVEASGGRLLSAMAGLELVTGKMAFGAQYQHPLSQQLANGMVKAQERLMLHIAFAW